MNEHRIEIQTDIPEYALVKPAFREVIARAVQKDSPLWLADDKSHIKV